jgi:hypothetical protein
MFNLATIVPVLWQDLDFHGICGSGERYICLCFVDIGEICDDQFTIIFFIKCIIRNNENKLSTCHKVSLNSLMLEAVYVCHLMSVIT